MPFSYNFACRDGLPKPHRLRLMGHFDNISAWCRRLDALVQLSIASIAVIALSMCLLGSWIEKRIRESWIVAAGETTALYMGSSLAPYVYNLSATGVMSQADREGLSDLTKRRPLIDRVEFIKIWDISGNLVYSTREPIVAQRIAPNILSLLMRGNAYIKFRAYSHGSAVSNHNYLEIYSPLYDGTTGKIVGFGEFYKNGDNIGRQIDVMKYGVWHAVILIMSMMATVLFVLVRRSRIAIDQQQGEVKASLKRAEYLSRRNEALRRAAEQARMDAISLNEAYLAGVGSEIHDGPVQVLTLALLKVPSHQTLEQQASDELKQATALIRSAVGELRTLSSGLILPELQGLPLERIVNIAVQHHIEQTGTDVAVRIGRLPEHVEEAVGVCAYRVVREGLMNSFKHAGGKGQEVGVLQQGGAIEIEICDRGEKKPTPVNEGGNTGIGLRGMNARLKALRGSVQIHDRKAGGSCLTARIPLARQTQLTEAPLSDVLPAF